MSVSVCMTTRNSAAWLAEAVESVLAQRAPFDVELVVGDNASEDDTVTILRGYAARHPGNVRLIARPSDIGLGPNFAGVIGERRGEYTAFLDSDDVWTDPDKLARQVAFLEAHPECAFCFHPAVVERDGEAVGRLPAADVPAVGDGGALYGVDNPVFLGSVVARSAALKPLPGVFPTLPVNDWALCLLLADRGAVGFLPETIARYRVHEGGSWSRLPPLERVLRSVDTLVRLSPALSPASAARLAPSVDGLADWWAGEAIFGEGHQAEMVASSLQAAEPATARRLIRALIDTGRRLSAESAWRGHLLEQARSAADDGPLLAPPQG